MATARCYSKSGSVEKYESNLWIDPTDRNWSSSDIVGTITTPDSRGNYTVTPATGFEDSNTQTGFYCHTMYGGVRKTFYFIKRKTRITFKLAVLSSDGVGTIICSISGPLPTDVFITIARINGIKEFGILCKKTSLYKGAFHFYTDLDPTNTPKVGEQWRVAVVRPDPAGADLGDFEYVADTTTYFTIKY